MNSAIKYEIEITCFSSSFDLASIYHSHTRLWIQYSQHWRICQPDIRNRRKISSFVTKMLKMQLDACT